MIIDQRSFWVGDDFCQIPLGLIGLLALADLDVVPRCTALRGTSAWSGILMLCPGLHRQQEAAQLQKGEFPACAAMTTGHVFRIENPATVFYLQSIGETGKLTNISVSKEADGSSTRIELQHVAVASSVLALACLTSIADWWALSYFLVLVLIRLINTMVIRSRACVGWHGQSEPGQRGDLFVLLSYDRWVRIQGEVDDLKAVTSGRWLHRPTMVQDAMSGCAKLLAYMAPTIIFNASHRGQTAMAWLFLLNAAVLGAANRLSDTLYMKGRILRTEGQAKAYNSRRVLANELIAESGRTDWAIAMSLIPNEPHYRGSFTL